MLPYLIKKRLHPIFPYTGYIYITLIIAIDKENNVPPLNNPQKQNIVTYNNELALLLDFIENKFFK